MTTTKGILHNLGAGWTAVEYPAGYFLSGPSAQDRVVEWTTATLDGAFSRNVAGHFPLAALAAFDALVEAKVAEAARRPFTVHVIVDPEETEDGLAERWDFSFAGEFDRSARAWARNFYREQRALEPTVTPDTWKREIVAVWLDEDPEPRDN